MAQVASGLAAVLTRLARDPAGWVLIIEVGPSAAMVDSGGCRPGVCMSGYLQWLVYPDRSCVAEVSSSASLDSAHALTGVQEGPLVGLGWAPPRRPPGPNLV